MPSILNSMPMLVVHVGHVRVRVLERGMVMRMRMRLFGGVFGTVLMPVMLVMHV
jgi:hypothetical protein